MFDKEATRVGRLPALCARYFRSQPDSTFNTEAGGGTTDEVAAAVFVYRALAWLAPIPCRGVAVLPLVERSSLWIRFRSDDELRACRGLNADENPEGRGQAETDDGDRDVPSEESPAGDAKNEDSAKR